MRLTKLLMLILIPGFLLPSVLSAQAVRNAKEIVTNEKQIADGKAQLARDENELDEFAEILAEMDAMRRIRELGPYYKLNTRLRSAMQREYTQARAKAGQAAHEVKQSTREAVSERREAAVTGDARDRAQARDDRRDLRDDRRDFGTAAERARRMEALISKTSALDAAVHKGDETAMNTNSALMHEFLEVLRADVRATRAELGEDRQERREDRRESRTDRNK